jgi:murein DD-endopeptidase MepM/ murein hydrolase activator NlpD
LSLTSVRLLTKHLTAENIGQETHEKLRRLQALLRREIPDGDPGAIFDRALTVLLQKVEKTKLAVAGKPRPRPIRPTKDARPPIRPAADTEGHMPDRPSSHVRPEQPSRDVPPAPLSRTVPREVKREVWRRDAGQCAFVSPTGRRCTEGIPLIGSGTPVRAGIAGGLSDVVRGALPSSVRASARKSWP